MGQSDRSGRPSGDGGPDEKPGGRSQSGGLPRRKLLLFGGLATVGLFAITRGEFGSDPAETDVRLLLNLNARTLEADDLDGHVGTLHPDAPIYDETQNRATEIIRNHNVTVELTVDNITVDNATAEAEAVRTIRGTAEDSSYEDIRERLTYELRRLDGEWLIYNRTVRETEQPPPADG